MKENGNRRDFLKTTSISAAVICMMLFALWSSVLGLDKGMITIIMARDTLCFVDGVVDQERVQFMVDASVAELTGVIDDLPLAYKCLFPMVTEETKILIKYNPLSPETTRKPLVDALKNGLTYMLDYTFPEENISIVGGEGEVNTSTDTILIDSTIIVYDTTIFTFDSLGNPDTIIVSTATTIFAFDSLGNPDTIQVPTPTTPSDTIPGLNLKYAIKDPYFETDYIIYCPSAMVSDAGCGVDMSLNLMTTSIEGIDSATLDDLYALCLDTVSPSLSLLNFHTTFNGDFGKPVLYLMDLISYSPTGKAQDLVASHKIYMTNNITVSDWKGIRYLKDSVGVLTEEQEQLALKVCTLSCVPYVDLGVVNEGQMLEIAISPPWITATAPVDQKIPYKDIQIKTNSAYTIFSYPSDAGSHAIISIYDIHGREIWSHRGSEKSIVWNKNDLHGHKVPSGVYIYQLKAGEIKAQGKTTIKR